MFDGTAEQAFRKWDHSGEIETADLDLTLKSPMISY